MCLRIKEKRFWINWRGNIFNSFSVLLLLITPFSSPFLDALDMGFLWIFLVFSGYISQCF